MPRRYVIVSSSSNGTSRDSYGYSRSVGRQRHGRSRSRGASSRPEQPESLHWWLARWLSSEFAKIAGAVYEGGKGCIRYLSTTALQALPSVRAAREIREELEGTRRSRGGHRGNRSLYTVPDEALEVRKSRRSHWNTTYGRRDRHSSPYDSTHVSHKHSRHAHGCNKSQHPGSKQGSRRSHRHERFGDDWIREKNWIENLLKEVKSNFKNPVKVKLYQVSPGEDARRAEHSTGSDGSATSKFGFSVEELVSPTYPSGRSELVSSSGAGKSSDTTAVQSSSVAKTRGPSRKGESSQRSPYAPAKSAQPATALLEKLATPTFSHQESALRLSLDDFHDLSAKASTPPSTDRADISMSLNDEKPIQQSKTNAPDLPQPGTAVPTAPLQMFDFHHLRHGDVFYPVPGKKCTVVCEDVASVAERNVTEQQSSMLRTPDSGQDPKTLHGLGPSRSRKDAGAPDDRTEQHGHALQADTSPRISLDPMAPSHQPASRPFSASLASVATRDDDPALIFLVRPRDSETTNPAIDISGVSLGANAYVQLPLSNAATDLQQNGVELRPSDIHETPTPELPPSYPEVDVPEDISRTGSPENLSASDDQTDVAEPTVQMKKTPVRRDALSTHNINDGQYSLTDETADVTFTEKFTMIEQHHSIFTDSNEAEALPFPNPTARPLNVGDEVGQNKVEDLPTAQPFSASRSLLSVATSDDDPALLLLVRPREGDTTNPAIDISGVSLGAKASVPLPFSLPGHSRPAVTKTPSPPELPKTALHRGILKDSNSTILVPSRANVQSNSSKVLLAESEEKLERLAKSQTHSTSKTSTGSKSTSHSSSKIHMHGVYDKGHPDMLKSTSAELMEMIIDSSVPSLDVTSPTVGIEKPAEISISQNVTQKQNDDVSVIDEANTAQLPNTPSAMPQIPKARSIGSNVSGASDKEHIPTASRGTIPGSAVSLGPSAVNIDHSTVSKEGGESFRASEENVPSTYQPKGSASPSDASALETSSVGELAQPSIQGRPEIEALHPKRQSNDSIHKAYLLARHNYRPYPQYATSSLAGDPEELLLEVDSSFFERSRSDFGQSSLTGPPPIRDENDSSPAIYAPNGRLTFGQDEKISYSSSVLSDQERHAERFKLPERSSTATQNLPPIKEEEPANDVRQSSLSIRQQRRYSMVAPGMLDRKSHVSYSIEAASTPDAVRSDVSCATYKGNRHATERCPCKKICDCCSCGIVAPSLSRVASKDRPSAVDTGVKPASKQLSRIGAIDMSSKPVPKNSFDVLQSPFYAHWDYYDLDQDHPIARFVRRPEHAEFDPTDNILIKNVRIGGYLIPYLKVSTKEKVTPKMVCNFYKSRKLPVHRKGNSRKPDVDGTNLDLEQSSSVELAKEEKRKCKCRETKEQEAEDDNIWKDYTAVEPSHMLDFPSDLFSEEKSKCSQTEEEGCMCIDKPDKRRKIPMPATPCESCDCFISDVELESAPIVVRNSDPPARTPSEPSIDRTAVVDEYICTLQELCTNLCGMIERIKDVIEETSPSVRDPPPKSTKPSPELNK